MDAFWSRAASTVESNAREIQKSIDERLEDDRQLDLPAMGPLPTHDHSGYGVAMDMLKAFK